MSDEERSPKEQARERTRDKKRDRGSALMNNNSTKVWHAIDALLVKRLAGEAPAPPRSKRPKKGKKTKRPARRLGGATGR